MSQLGVWRLPQWFKEGLAAMVSGGGGAEGVSESQARDAAIISRSQPPTRFSIPASSGMRSRQKYQANRFES